MVQLTDGIIGGPARLSSQGFARMRHCVGAIRCNRPERGQGAMEYLMSYGWVVFLIVVVGATMWRLGVYDKPHSTPTSSGFGMIKPLLATCWMGKGLPFPSQPHGFVCTFYNPTGSSIDLQDIKVLVDGKPCEYQFIADMNWNQYYGKECVSEDCASSVVYINRVPLPVQKDGTFLVSTYSYTLGSCKNMINGEAYDVDIDVTYDAKTFGTTVTKHSAGTVHLTSTEEIQPPMPVCSFTSDGICPAGCGDSLDADCCTQHHRIWIGHTCL